MRFMLFITPAIFYIMALIFLTGKANFLIAGYNTASKEEKEHINSKVLSKFMAILMFVIGTVQLAVPICKIYNIGNFDNVILGTSFATIAVIIIAVIYANTSKKINK